MKKTIRPTKAATQQRRLALAIAAALGFSGSAAAFELKSGNPDVSMRWDNQVRYNLGVRAEDIGDFGNNPAFDEGEHKFKRGDIVTNRIDLFSEFDFVYKRDHGFRVSAASWYDHAYRDPKAKRNPDLPNEGSYENDKYSSYTSRYFKGLSGEILDAFAFTRLDFGEVPVYLKAGRHTVYWGESLLGGGVTHGVAYSQAPQDLGKGFANPGTLAKELFLPLSNISAVIQPTPDLSIAAQYFLEWKPTRIPEGGTFLGPSDILMYGPDRVAPGLVNGGMIEPDDRGDWGVSARWAPSWSPGTIGFYYRNFTDKTPTVLMRGGQYNTYFGENIDLYGLSLATDVRGVSVGMEVSYRRNMPLHAQTLGVVSGNPAFFPTGEPHLIDNSYQARGNTFHALINAVGVLPTTDFYSTANWNMELTYARLDKVTDNQDMFYGEGYGLCNASRADALGADLKEKWDGCATKDVLGIAFNFSPVWMGVFPGVDLSMPINYSRGLHGNSPVSLGGNEKNGSYSIGLVADVRNKFNIALRYIDYYGETKSAPSPIPGESMAVSPNGLSTALKDRGWVSLTMSTSF